MSGPFATATELCEFTGMTLPSDLARLQSILGDASAEIRGFTGQILDQVVDDQVTFPPWSSSLLVLPERPVTAVSSVLVGGVAQATTTYSWTRGGHVWRLDGKNWSFLTSSTTGSEITVTYTHGYAEADPVFQRIKTICIQIAARAFTLNERSASEAMGSTLMETAGYSPEIFLTPGEQFRLSDYAATVFA